MANDTEKRITAKMVLDSTGFNSSLQGLNSNLKVAQAELKNANASVGTFGKSSENLKSVQESLAKQIELHAKKVDIYKESITKTTDKMSDNIAKRDELKASLVSANAKYDETVKLYGKESDEAAKAKEDVNKLSEEHKKAEKAVESNVKQIQGYTTNLNKAESELTKTQGELQKTNKELANHESKWISAGKSLNDTGEKLKTVGNITEKVGDKVLKLSAPLLGAEVASAKFSMDFADGMAKVSTVADTSKISLEKLGKGVIDLSNMSGEGFETIQDGLYDTISSGVKAEDSMKFLTVAVKAAKGGFTDTTTSVDGLTTVLNAYGLKTSEVTNIANQMFIAQNLGKTTFGEMSSSIGNVIPTTAALKVSTSELFSSLATLTANGIKTSEAVTGLKSAYSNIAKPSDDAAKMAEKLGLKFNSAHLQSVGWGKFLEEVKAKTNGNTEELYQLFGSVEAVNTVLTMTSDQGMSLFKDSMNQMQGNTSALDDAFNKVDNTAGNKLKKSFNELKNASIQFGDALAPTIGEVTNVIGSLTKSLEGMDKGTLQTIAKVGMFTVALGGILKVGGSIVSGSGAIMGVIGNIATKLGTAKVAAEGVGVASKVAAGASGVAGLGTSLGGIAIAAAPWLIAGAAIVGTGYAINKAMSQQAIPSVNLFADGMVESTKKVVGSNGQMETGIQNTVAKIAEHTQKMVGAYVKMDDDTKKSLTDLYVNGTIITDKTVTTLVGKYNEMGTQIKDGMDTHYNEEYGIMQQFFQKSSALSTTEETIALANLQKSNTDKKTEIDNYTKQIQGILKKASDEKRTLTSDEQQKINEIQEKMKTNAVKSLSDSEVESKVILERLKDYGTRITAEQASAEIKNANKARDESISAAKSQYDKTVAEIIKMRDETHSITSEQADKLIADAKRQKDDSITHAEELRTGVVDKIKTMDSDIENSVDTSSGNILTTWDKLKKWWDGWVPSVKTFFTQTIAYNPPTNATNIEHKASGDSDYHGGLTTLHENGYEVYDLPKSTRIYNHEASEDLVLKTAQEVAKGVLNNGGKGITQTVNIYSPTALSPAETARQNKRVLQELALQF